MLLIDTCVASFDAAATAMNADAAAAPPAAAAVVAAAATPAAAPAAPVSYTHLTLPTIYSV